MAARLIRRGVRKRGQHHQTKSSPLLVFSPLVPTDGHPDAAKARVKDLETRISRVEVELLLVTRAVGDVGLPVDAEVGPIGVHDCNGVEVRIVGTLKKRDWVDMEKEGVGWVKERAKHQRII